MRKAIALLAVAASAIALAQPASAGPGFAYSWLTTKKTFDQCMVAAMEVVASLKYPRAQATRFGATGETDEETIYINCEDLNHVAVLLVRPTRPKVGEIDALVALMQERLAAVAP